MKTLSTIAALGCVLTAATASAETMILAEGLPNGHYLSVNISEPLMACISEGTKGAIDFNYMPGGQLLKMTDGTEGLQQGLADFAFVSIGNEAANYPLNGLTMLPGLATSAVEGSSAWRKAVEAGGELAGEFEKVGLTPITMTILAPYQAVGKKHLDTPEAWKGQKFRVSGTALSFLVEAIGGTPVTFPATDFFVAMQRGTVDGSVISFASVKPYSVHEVATHYSRNLSLGTSTSMFAMNTERFNSLPADQQAVIKDCGLKIETAAAQVIDNQEAVLAKEMEGMGHTVYDLTPEQLEVFAKAIAPVEAELVKRVAELGLPAQAALDEYKAALKK